jgi:hypothetical protein
MTTPMRWLIALPLLALACAAPRAHTEPSPTPPAPASSAAASLPAAENVDPELPDDAPTISVVRGEVQLEGQRVDDTHAFAGNTALHGEFAALKVRREAWKASHPGERLPGIVLFRFEADLPVAIVKSVFQTAAFAAYPNASFIVRIEGSDRA